MSNVVVATASRLVALCLTSALAAADEEYGYERRIFDVGEHKASIILPRVATAEAARPWIWHAPTLISGYPNQSNEWLFRRLLERGWAIAGVDVGESHGSPAGRAVHSRFYDQAIPEYGLDSKACLVPQSRGGLMLYNWAAENAEKVRCIAAIYPVCDIRAYPGLDKAAPAYGMTEAELTEHLGNHNPVDRLAPLAEAAIPIFHIHGDTDTVVSLEQNSQVLYGRYTALGGQMELVIVEGMGHAEIPEFFQSGAMLGFLPEHGETGS